MVELSWVEVDGAGWRWVEVDGAGWRWGHGLVIPIKKSKVTGITQKSHTALFPLWSLRKNDISKDIYIKKYI